MTDDAHFLRSLSVELRNSDRHYYADRCEQIAAKIGDEEIKEAYEAHCRRRIAEMTQQINQQHKTGRDSADE